MTASKHLEPLPSLGMAQTLFLSFVSQAPYRVAALTWRLRTWLYLMLLVAVVQFPNVLRTMQELERDVAQAVDKISAELPEVGVRNGLLVTSGAQERREISIGMSFLGVAPKLILDLAAASPVFPQESEMTVVVTSREFAVRFPDGQIHSGTFSLAGDFQITKAVLSSYGDLFVRVGWLLLPLFLAIGGTVMLFVRVLILALGGWMFFPHGKGRLTFGASFRVALVAAGPSTVLEALLAALGVASFGWQLVSLLLAITYYLYGIRAFLPPVEETENDL